MRKEHFVNPSQLLRAELDCKAEIRKHAILTDFPTMYKTFEKLKGTNSEL